MLAFMTPIFPPDILIPLHGIIQLSSNIARVSLSLKNINWKITILFAIGAGIGALIGSQFLIQVPKDQFRIILAVAILFMTWTPKLNGVPNMPGQFAIIGAIASFLSLFIGSTGPFTAPFFLRANLGKQGIVATKASCQIPIHLFKLGTYIAFGFLLTPWLNILMLIIPMVFLGNWIGKMLLGKVPEDKFRLLLKILITLLGIRMVLQSAQII